MSVVLLLVVGQLAAAAQPVATLEDTALRATVRIMSTHNTTVRTGTGSVIGRQQGYAIVLTAEHVLPHAGDECEVQFWPHDDRAPVSTTYSIIHEDAAADLALMRVLLPKKKFPGRLPLAPRGTRLAPPLPVLTVGCSGGQPPSCQSCGITELRSRKHDGGTAEFWYTDREPVQGRSGGPLLLGRYVVGVCSAGGSGEGVYASLQEIFELCDAANAAWLYEPDTQSPLTNVQAISWSVALAATGPPRWVDPAHWCAVIDLTLTVRATAQGADSFLIPVPCQVRLPSGMHLVGGQDCFTLNGPGSLTVPLTVEFTANRAVLITVMIEPTLNLPDLRFDPPRHQVRLDVAQPAAVVTTISARAIGIEGLRWDDLAQGTAALEAVVVVHADGPLGDRTTLALTAPPGVRALRFSQSVIRPGQQTLRMGIIASVAPAPHTTRLVFPFLAAPAGAIQVRAPTPLVIDVVGPPPARLTLVDARGRSSPFLIRLHDAGSEAALTLRPVLDNTPAASAPPDLLADIEVHASFPVAASPGRLRLLETATLWMEPARDRLAPPLLRDILRECRVTVRPAAATPAVIGSTHTVTFRQEAYLTKLLPVVAGGGFVFLLVVLSWRFYARLADDRWEHVSSPL